MEKVENNIKKNRKYGTTIANVIVLFILIVAGTYGFIFIFERRVIIQNQNTTLLNDNTLTKDQGESKLLLQTENDHITEEDINILIEKIIEDEGITAKEVEKLAEEIGI